MPITFEQVLREMYENLVAPDPAQAGPLPLTVQLVAGIGVRLTVGDIEFDVNGDSVTRQA